MTDNHINTFYRLEKLYFNIKIIITMKIIVIGASAGGWESISKLCRSFPEGLRAAVLIVWHISMRSENNFPLMLAKETKLPVESAVNNKTIMEGRIYTAPPNNHLIIEDHKMRVVYGPKENRFRPAIDPLFRSAAYNFGSNVIGILLSGMLSDGTAGLWTIKDRGGISLVQDPDEAQFPDMPSNALKNMDVDYKLSVDEMAPLLIKLTEAPSAEKKLNPDIAKDGIEIRMASDDYVSDEDIKKIGEVTEFTCPECHGSLWRIEQGSIIRFRCRTGHAFSVPALLEELSESIERQIWAAIRGLEENTSLIKYLTQHLHSEEDRERLDIYMLRADQSQQSANILRKLLTKKIVEQTSAG